MASVTLSLDEDVRPLLADILCDRGFDVVSAVRAQHLGLTDEEQLHAAIKAGRTFLTHNVRDFVRLHARFADRHHGILVSSQEPLHVLLRRILSFLSRETAESVQGQLRWLSDYEPRP